MSSFEQVFKRRNVTLGTLKAMRGRIALQKHFVRNPSQHIGILFRASSPRDESVRLADFRSAHASSRRFRGLSLFHVNVKEIAPRFITLIVAVTIVPITLHSTFAQEKSDEELAKQLSNPVASLISVPFQSNFEFNLGPNNDGFKYTLNFQPVIPFSLNKDWNLITRTIVPFIDQSDVLALNTSQAGLSDITQSFFFSPKNPVAGMIVGVGPAFLYPAATDDLLGTEKWGAGPTFVVLKQVGGWTYGVLFNHIWSFAGNEHRTYVSSTFFQPFISYTTKKSTTFGVNTESSYDWHNDQLTAPINFTVAQLTKIGKLPVQFTIGGKVYAEGPGGAPEWGIRFVVTPLFPTGGKHPPEREPSDAK